MKDPKGKNKTKKTHRMKLGATVKKESKGKDKVCAHQARMEVEKEVKKKTKVENEVKRMAQTAGAEKQDRDNMSEGLNANWKDYYPDLIEEEGSGWPPSVNRRLNVRAPQKKSMVPTDKELPKGVRICKGPVPMPRIPTREKCQEHKTPLRATQRKRQRTCLSPSGCGKIFCEDCYP